MKEREIFKVELIEEICKLEGKLPAGEIVEVPNIVKEEFGTEYWYEVEYNIPSVSTIEEARQSSAQLFKYPAHDVDCMLLTDIRMLEWMMKVSDPLTKGNYWEPRPSWDEIENAIKYLKTMKKQLDRFGFDMFIEGGTFDYRIDAFYDERSEKMSVSGIPNGVSLGNELSSDVWLAIISWMIEVKNIDVQMVAYGSPLHAVWLGFVRD